MLISQLKYVNEISKCGSFNQAASNLYITQSALSIAVKNLEKELKITIFKRTNRGVILTDEGKEVLNIIRMILKYVEDLQNVSERMRRQTPLLVCPVFLKKYGHFILEICNRDSFTINEMASPLIFENVKNNIFPVGICSIVTPIYNQIMRAKNIGIIELFEEELKLVVHKNNELSKKEEIILNDLDGISISLFTNQSPHSCFSYWSNYPDRFQSVSTYNHISSLLENITEVAGITILADSAIEMYSEVIYENCVVKKINGFNNRLHYVVMSNMRASGEVLKNINEVIKVLQKNFEFINLKKNANLQSK